MKALLIVIMLVLGGHRRTLVDAALEPQCRHAGRGCARARQRAHPGTGRGRKRRCAARAGSSGRSGGAARDRPVRRACATPPRRSRGRTYRWQSHQRFLARRCLRNTASQRMPIFSSTRIEALLFTSTVEITRSARKSKNAASMQRERDLGGESLAPVGRPEHVAQVDHVALDQATDRRRR